MKRVIILFPLLVLLLSFTRGQVRVPQQSVLVESQIVQPVTVQGQKFYFGRGNINKLDGVPLM